MVGGGEIGSSVGDVPDDVCLSWQYVRPQTIVL